MKIIILLISFLIISFGVCQAQQIEMDSKRSGYIFKQDGEQLKIGDLVLKMEDHSQASELIKRAELKLSHSEAINFIGGAFIGYPIGTALGGGEANWVLAGIGAGLVFISLPIKSSGNRNAREAVELYNQSYNTFFTDQSRPEFRVNLNGMGIGISMSF